MFEIGLGVSKNQRRNSGSPNSPSNKDGKGPAQWILGTGTRMTKEKKDYAPTAPDFAGAIHWLRRSSASLMTASCLQKQKRMKLLGASSP